MRIRPTVKVFSGRIDVIPLINVMFLLLLFFVISSSLVFQAGVPVELPAAVRPEMRATDKLVVTLTRNGLLFLNDKPVRRDELERELRELVYETRKTMAFRSGEAGGGHAAAARPLRTPAVLLQADKQVPYDQIMEVVSLARSLKLGVFMASAPPPQATPLPAAPAPGRAD